MVVALGVRDILSAVTPIPDVFIGPYASAPVENAEGIFLFEGILLVAVFKRTLAGHTVLLHSHKEAMEPWHFVSEDGRFDLTMTPTYDHHSDMNK